MQIDQNRLRQIINEATALNAAAREAGNIIRNLRSRLSELRGQLNPGVAPVGPEWRDGLKMNEESRKKRESECARLLIEIQAAEEQKEILSDRATLAGRIATAARDYARDNGQLPADLEVQ